MAIRISHPDRDFTFVDKDSLNPKEQLRDFKGIWIPKAIWLSKLSFLEKCLWAEIDSLSKSSNGCYASNEYLARFMGATERHIIRALSVLKKRGLIKAAGFDGRRRYLKSNIQKMS